MMARGQFLQAHPLLCALLVFVGYTLPAIAAMLPDDDPDDDVVVAGNLQNSSELVGRVLAPAAFHRLEGLVVVVDGSVHVTSLLQMIDVHLPVFGIDAFSDIPDSRSAFSVPTVSRPGVIGRVTLVLTRWGMPVC
mgnify:CR=1 FL=1